MVTSEIIDAKSMLNFRLTSHCKEARHEKKHKQEQKYYCAMNKKQCDELEFMAYDFLDSLAIEIFIDDQMTDTAIARLGNLVVMPLKFILDQQESVKDESL